MLATATQLPPYATSLVIDILDATCWAVLARAGATPQEALTVLADLWVPDTNTITRRPGGELVTGRMIMDLVVLRRIADALQVPVAWLTGDDAEPDERADLGGL